MQPSVLVQQPPAYSAKSYFLESSFTLPSFGLRSRRYLRVVVVLRSISAPFSFIQPPASA